MAEWAGRMIGWMPRFAGPAPDKLREVVGCCLYHHMRYEEIGVILNIPVER
jgi:DNA-directed RNA polymerase specialized sigma24 family protein